MQTMSKAKLTVIALLLAACSAPVVAPVGPPVPGEVARWSDYYTATAAVVATGQALATQNAQATVDTINRNATQLAVFATATSDANSGLATSQAVAMAPQLTWAAGTATAAPATSTAAADIRASNAAATQTAAQATQERNQAYAWQCILMIGVLALSIGLSLSMLIASRSYATQATAPRVLESFAIEQVEGRTYTRQLNPFTGIIDMKLLPPTTAAPALKSPEELAALDQANHAHQLRRAWRLAIRDAARAASIAGTWKVSKLSNREGALGVMSEDALADITGILEQAGWLTNHGGRRGYDWADGWNYIALEDMLDRDDLEFEIPTTPLGEHKPAPSILLGNATQVPLRNATTQSDDEPVVISPMPRGRKESAVS
jgi:hypothetical protein